MDRIQKSYTLRNKMNIPMKPFVIITLFILTIFSSSAFAVPDSINTTVDGVGTIINGNVAVARVSAIDNALKKAIEEAVETIVSKSVIAQNYSLLDENIYSKHEEYIRNYKVNSEKPTGNIYQITIEALISTTLLEDNLSKLGLIDSKRVTPRILLMIAQEDEAGGYHSWWIANNDVAVENMGAVERVITEKIRERGYLVVSREETSIPDSLSGINPPAMMSEGEFAYYGKHYNADMILYGTAHSLSAKNVNGEKGAMAHAIVSISLINAKTGHLVASSENEELTDGTSIKEAFIKTITILSDRVMNQIAAQWQNDSDAVKTVEMTISGIRSYVSFMKFEEALRKEIKGVQEVTQKGFGAGAARLDILLKGNVQALADGLTMISYEGFSIDITEIGHDKISVTMKSL